MPQLRDLPPGTTDACPWCNKNCGFARREAEAIAAFYNTLIAEKVPANLAERLTFQWTESVCACDSDIDEPEWPSD